MPTTHAPAGWKPLLEPTEEIRDALDAVIGDVRSIASTIRSGTHGQRADEVDPTLASGWCGPTLLLDYAARGVVSGGSSSSSRPSTEVQELLAAAIESLASCTLHPGLHPGFSGVAWTAAHLAGPASQDRDESLGENPEEESAEDLYEEIDGALLDFTRRARPGDYDLMTGVVGIGVYALERMPSPAARELLEAVVQWLATDARVDAQGARWFTPPELVGPQGLRFHPEGYFNLGVAHGVPGVIGLLGGIWAAGVAREEVEPLLRGAVDWLLAQRLPPPSKVCFPYAVSPGVEPVPSRLGWCYGDPGIAAVLLNAARAVGEPAWERAAVEIGLRGHDLERDEAGVRDAGLCHGAAGLAHIYNRLWQVSDREPFHRASCVWLRRSLSYRRPGKGVGGYVKDPDDPGVSEGFLGGASGIGLALLAATTPIAPDWDRVLLLSHRRGSV